MTRISVTPEQVRAARLEVEALKSAGLTPDPMVVSLARAAIKDNYAKPATARHVKRTQGIRVPKVSSNVKRIASKSTGRKSKAIARTVARHKSGEN